MTRIDTRLHLNMFRVGLNSRRFSNRIKQAFKILFNINNLYGLEWGDPEVLPPLKYIKEHFLLPFVSKDATIIEIGPGGGRWTQYIVSATKIYAVDYHDELLTELKKSFHKNKNIIYLKNNGDDFPGIPEDSIDLIFSFGTFVHLDLDIIDRYLLHIKPLLKRNTKTNVVLQYSDKTKPLGVENAGFSDNDPDKMRKLILSHGYAIYEEDVKTMWHSSVIRFGLM